MKKITLLLFFVISSINAFCQNMETYAFDNCSMGYVLFPQDSIGNVSFCDTIVSNPIKRNMQDKLRLWLYDIENVDKYNISDLLILNGAIRFSVQLPVGERYVSFGVMGSSDNIGTFKQTISYINFNVSINYSDSLVCYKLSDFITKRRRIQGNAKENGSPNYINWQRINSLNAESKEYENDMGKRGKKGERAKANFDEKMQMIEEEEKQYHSEYDKVLSFIRSLYDVVTANE